MIEIFSPVHLPRKSRMAAQLIQALVTKCAVIHSEEMLE